MIVEYKKWGVTISAGRKIFLHCEIVLCMGLGAVALAVGGVLGRCGCLVAVCLLPSVGVSVALFGANKKRSPVWVSAFGCVARSILRYYPQEKDKRCNHTCQTCHNSK